MSTGIIKTKVNFPIEGLDLTKYVINHQETHQYFRHQTNTVQGHDLDELIQDDAPLFEEQLGG